MLLFPIGWWWCRSIDSLKTADRLQNGLILILPGIQGKSPIEFAVARGLADARIELGIEVFDWTTGLWPLFLFHLRASRRHQNMANKLAQRITEYSNAYPDRPIFLIGHSGGAALSLFAAQCLPPGKNLAAIFLLAPAVSPGFDYRSALQNTQSGIWNFYSPLDVLFLMLGTVCFGTIDGRLRCSAGAVGFRSPPQSTLKTQASLHQVCFSPRMMTSGNFGGHFGPTNRLFVADYLAPLIFAHTHLT